MKTKQDVVELEHSAVVQAANDYYLEHIHKSQVEVSNPHQEVFDEMLPMMLNMIAAHAFLHEIEDKNTKIVRQAMVNLEHTPTVCGKMQ